MFYLKEFFQGIWALRGRGVFFIASTITLALVCTLRPTINKGTAALLPEMWAKPYFTALFDKTVAIDQVTALMQGSPDVAEVQGLVGSEAQGVLGRLVRQLGDQYGQTLKDATASGIRVILKNQVSTSDAQELQDNLEKSYGSEHVTTSGIRTPKVGGLFQTHPIFRYLARAGYMGVLIPVMIVWILAFSLCFPDFSKRAWLVERFQRRRLVRPKTLAMGFAAIALASTILALAIQGLDVVGLLICLSVFSIPWCVSMREVKWKN